MYFAGQGLEIASFVTIFGVQYPSFTRNTALTEDNSVGSDYYCELTVLCNMNHEYELLVSSKCFNSACNQQT